jgi:glycosyltransferase involved in cell wall biosynthesis
MKIAQFNCNERPVPANGAGGIEKIIYLLTKRLIELGHQVTVFSTGDSRLPDGAELVKVTDIATEYLPVSQEQKDRLNDKYTLQLIQVLASQQDKFDIVHNHCLGAGLPVLDMLKGPHLSTLHESFDENVVNRLLPYKSHPFVSISRSQQEFYPDLNYLANIYHSIDISEYLTPTAPQDFLLCVSRISSQKTPHHAIEIAAKLNKRLVLIGKYKDDEWERDYYYNTFLPVYEKYKNNVVWKETVPDEILKGLFNSALATLLTVSYRESFGIAAIESMASGCPVIAFAKGAYLENIVDKETGIVVDDSQEAIQRFDEVLKIDRQRCREHVAEGFSHIAMTDQYVKIYSQIIGLH